MSVPTWAWFAVLALIVAMLAVDLFAHRRASVISGREALVWSAVWLAIGVGFGAVIWAYAGAELGQQYFTGYLIEKSLAVDNVFVWAMIFGYFAVPPAYQHRVLFLGVIGALVLRGGMIAAGAAVIERAQWVLYVFAAILLLTGWRMLRTRDEHFDPASSRMYLWLARRIPTTPALEGDRFFVRQTAKNGAKGALVATPLLLVLLLVEGTDVVFALDSIPAIFAVTSEPFLVFTANAFALLGMRALYFLLADLIDRFVYLKVGLALVMLWVGVKMVLQVDLYHVPTTVSLAVVVLILGASVVASLRATRPSGLASAAVADEDEAVGGDGDRAGQAGRVG